MQQTKEKATTFLDETLPFENEVCRVGLNKILEKVWNIINNKESSEKSVLQALSLLKVRSWIENHPKRTYFPIITDMIPQTHNLRIQLVENADIVAIRELLLDVKFGHVQMFKILQVWFSPIKRIKRRHVRHVIAQIASGRLKVPALISLQILHHDILCTFCRRFILLHGIPSVALDLSLG